MPVASWREAERFCEEDEDPAVIGARLAGMTGGEPGAHAQRCRDSMSAAYAREDARNGAGAASEASGKTLRNSVRATYDSRETGPRYHVTTRLGDRTIAFQERVADPFVSHTVTVGWPDLLRGLLRRHLQVTVIVGGDPDVVNDVLELDDNALVPNSTRQAAFRSHLNEAIGRIA